ncbi:MAG: 30S ribosomal protein S17 [Vicinamibacterales bacterium]|nr:30S ribosomal protein S17 [Vicinamibacterales bacterium]
MASKTELTGTVVSDKMAKSRIVAVERQVRHGLYGKTRRLTSTFMAHDEANETRKGDVVAIAESRPLSRRKRWVITRLVQRPAGVGAPAATPSGPQR